MSSGTNNTTGGDHDALVNRIYPIGSIYITVMNIDPNTTFGIGSWQAFATGRTLVGIDSNHSKFNTVGKTGGKTEHVLTVAEMPIHTHSCGSTTPSNTGAPSENSTDMSGKHSHWIVANGLSLEVGAGNPDRGTTYSFDDNLKQSGHIYQAHEDLIVEGIHKNSAHMHSLKSHTHASATHAHTNANAGGGVAHENLPPYITVYMWQRIA